jgi:cellobiose-specific phosphotransferase system component IIC
MIGLIVGLVIVLSPKAHLAALRDATIWGLGWVLVAVSVLLLLTNTLAAPPTAHDQAPTAPATSHSHPVWHPEAAPLPTGR